MIDWPLIIERIEQHVQRERERASRCDGKHGYDTSAQAREHGVNPRWGGVMNIYHCEFCSKYHIGAPGKGRKNAVRPLVRSGQFNSQARR